MQRQPGAVHVSQGPCRPQWQEDLQRSWAEQSHLGGEQARSPVYSVRVETRLNCSGHALCEPGKAAGGEDWAGGALG